MILASLFAFMLAVVFAYMLHFTLFIVAAVKIFSRKIKIIAAVPLISFAVMVFAFWLEIELLWSLVVVFLHIAAIFPVVLFFHLRGLVDDKISKRWLALAFFLPIIGSLIYISVYIRSGNAGVEGDV